MQKDGKRLTSTQLVELEGYLKERRSKIHFSVFSSQQKENAELEAKIAKTHTEIREFMNAKIKEDGMADVTEEQQGPRLLSRASV